MLSYIKTIKLYLFIIISIFFSNISFAHEIKPSIADFTYDENYLNIEVRLNAELILSNICWPVLLLYKLVQDSIPSGSYNMR